METSNQRLVDIAAAGLKRAGREISTRYGTKPGELWTTAQPACAVSKVNINASQYPKSLKIRLYCATPKVQQDLKQAALELCLERGLAIAKIDLPRSQDQHPACRLAVEILVPTDSLRQGVQPSLLGPEGWGPFVLAVIQKVDERTSTHLVT